MPKKEKKLVRTQGVKPVQDRESKILNIMVNTSVLLMALMTDAFSDVFTGMAAGVAQAMTAGFEGAEKQPKTKDTIKHMSTAFSKQMIAQMLQMKTDMNKQLQAKKKELAAKIADPKFDAGIMIAEHYNVGMPTLTHDLDERSLLTYVALLKAQDAQCTKLFQELMAWMKTVSE